LALWSLESRKKPNPTVRYHWSSGLGRGARRNTLTNQPRSKVPRIHRCGQLARQLSGLTKTRQRSDAIAIGRQKRTYLGTMGNSSNIPLGKTRALRFLCSVRWNRFFGCSGTAHRRLGQSEPCGDVNLRTIISFNARVSQKSE
jgi:hypothetical protein